MKSLASAIPRALTIAGSDSGGGAGIQADLKTFAALGVFGMSAVTSVTAQNTRRVVAVHDVPPRVVRAQIRAVVGDIGVDAVKTGMLHTAGTIEVVADELRRLRAPVVVDPVMVAKSGDPLLREDAHDALIERMLPRATVVTPNVPEAEILSGRKIRTPEQAKSAARAIARMGPRAVVVKGGHHKTREAVDLLYHRGKFRAFAAPRIETRSTHGTGCSFASAIAAGLARGVGVPDAVERAKAFVTLAVRAGLPLGRGHGPVHPSAWLHRDAARFDTLQEVAEAGRRLEGEPAVALLVPEAQLSITMALPWATSVEEVAAIPGRIVKMGRRARGVRASGWPEFGASHHVATAVLTAMNHDLRVRAGMNLRFGDDIVRAARGLGLRVSSYDRRREPRSIKAVENRTIAWGTEEAIRRNRGRVPDLFYHRGDWGKEPMCVLLGDSATRVAETAVRIARRLSRLP